MTVQRADASVALMGDSPLAIVARRMLKMRHPRVLALAPCADPALMFPKLMMIDRRRVRRATLVIAIGVIGLPVAARGQAPASPPPQDPWGVWTSLAVGRGSANRDPGLAGNLAAWVTHGPFAASVRYAGTSQLEAGDMSDGSLLVGIHLIRESHINGIIAIGAGLSSGHDGVVSLPQKPVMALGGQLMFNVAIIGIGLDAFAGLGSSRHYYGIGVALGLGGFSGVAPGP
jgi:hypothetical protein